LNSRKCSNCKTGKDVRHRISAHGKVAFCTCASGLRVRPSLVGCTSNCCRSLQLISWRAKERNGFPDVIVAEDDASHNTTVGGNCRTGASFFCKHNKRHQQRVPQPLASIKLLTCALSAQSVLLLLEMLV